MHSSRRFEENGFAILLGNGSKRRTFPAERKEKRLEKIKNTYDYQELYQKGKERKRVFKLGIPTDAGRTYDFCFRIPEKNGNARTRSVAMGNHIEQIACSEYEEVVAMKKNAK